jgi:hypothetical protein
LDAGAGLGRAAALAAVFLTGFLAGAGFVGFFGARLLMMGLPEALLPPLPLPLDSVQR